LLEITDDKVILRNVNIGKIISGTIPSCLKTSQQMWQKQCNFIKLSVCCMHLNLSYAFSFVITHGMLVPNTWPRPFKMLIYQITV